MRRWSSRWSDVLAPLAEVASDLVRAEYGVVSSEVRRAGRHLLKALLLLLIGLFALFWAIGAVALVVVEVASLWLPRWGAALVALGLFVSLGAVLAIVGRRRLRRIERPTETVKRRLSEHRDWWERKIAVVGAPRPSSRGDGIRAPAGSEADEADFS